MDKTEANSTGTQARIIATSNKADHKNLVEWNHEQSKRLIAEVAEGFDRVFDRIEAKLDQFATTLDMRRPDQSSPARMPETS